MRPYRIRGDGICYHVRVQCNNKEFRFKNQKDFRLYQEVLYQYVKKYGFQLHNYHLMHSHVHLILTTTNPFTIDRVMRSINQVFSIRYNLLRKRTGHVWLARYRSSIIDSDAYALCCMRYLDRNSLKAKLVSHPREWSWSGFHYYAYGTQNQLITPIATYLGLGNTPADRQLSYRRFVEEAMPSDDIRDREWIHSRWPRSLNGRK